MTYEVSYEHIGTMTVRNKSNRCFFDVANGAAWALGSAGTTSLAEFRSDLLSHDALCTKNHRIHGALKQLSAGEKLSAQCRICMGQCCSR